MSKHDWVVGFLLVVIIILSLALVDTRMSIQNNVGMIEVQAKKEKIVFAGDSITDGYDLNKYYQYENRLIINSGIGGYKTTNIVSRFKNLIEQHQADKVFLMIGTNDLGAGVDPEQVFAQTKDIIILIRQNSPNTKIYYETIYPINENIRPNDKRKNKNIKEVNRMMKEYCAENDIVYLDVYSLLVDSNDDLKEDYTNDGLHLTDEGYDVVTDYLRPYVEE